MKKFYVCIVSMMFVSMFMISAAGADELINTMFSAEDKAYFAQCAQGVSFAPVRTATVEKKSSYVNTMISEDIQDYVEAVNAGVDFTPVITQAPKSEPILANTMFSPDELAYLEKSSGDGFAAASAGAPASRPTVVSMFGKLFAGK